MSEQKGRIAHVAEKQDDRTEEERAADRAKMDALRARRDELAKEDPSKKGGRPKKVRLTAEEVREKALEMAAEELLAAQQLLQPHREAAIARLIGQIESTDENVAQRAIKLLLEITDGKPAQTIIEKQDGPKRIIFETAAFAPDYGPVPESDEVADFVPGARA